MYSITFAVYWEPCIVDYYAPAAIHVLFRSRAQATGKLLINELFIARFEPACRQIFAPFTARIHFILDRYVAAYTLSVAPTLTGNASKRRSFSS